MTVKSKIINIGPTNVMKAEIFCSTCSFSEIYYDDTYNALVAQIQAAGWENFEGETFCPRCNEELDEGTAMEVFSDS